MSGPDPVASGIEGMADSHRPGPNASTQVPLRRTRDRGAPNKANLRGRRDTLKSHVWEIHEHGSVRGFTGRAG